MLTKLPLLAVICVFLLTATIAAVTTTNTTTKTAPTARVNGIAESTTSRGKATTTAEITTNGNGSKSVSRSRSQQDVGTTPLDTQKFGNKINAVSEGARRAETTTSLLPLQPHFNVTTTTTSNFLTPTNGKSSARRQPPQSQPATQAQLLLSQPTKSQTSSASASTTNSTVRSSLTRALRQSNVNVEHVAVVVRNDSNTLQHDSTKKALPNVVQLIPAPVVEIYNENETSSGPNIDKHLRQEPKTSEYIHFDINEEDGNLQATAAPTRETRMETVNEVLSNLFPNGFTDIFRFSYASEQPTPASIATPGTDETSKPTSAATQETTPEAKLTTAPSNTITTTTTTTEKTSEAPTKAYYRYETSVSKEYRRELLPGHTEIVVEKLQLLPRSANVGSDEFSDGSNLITKDDLLRINRAAADAPVLPSLLMNPSQENVNGTEEKQSKKQTSIIILNDDDSADMEGISAEDNLIAESQNVGQRVYQRLPLDDKPRYGYKVGAQRQRPRPESEVNIRIVHDETPNLSESISQQPIFVLEEQQSEHEADEGKDATFGETSKPSQQLDNFQKHAEQSFHQLGPAPEAPSRHFLRNFNPVLSTGVATSTPKASFHYESNALQPIIFIQSGGQANKQSAESGAGAGKVENAAQTEGATQAQKQSPTQLPRLPLLQYDKDAAQIRYVKEQQLIQQQQQLLQQQQQFLLQQQQQEQQRQQHERLIKQQQDLQWQEKQQQQQRQQQQQQQQRQQQRQQQQQQKIQEQQQQKIQEQQQKIQEQQQQKIQEQQRQQHQIQEQQQQQQQFSADKRQQQFDQATSQYEQQQQLQQFHQELQQRQPQKQQQQQQQAIHQHYAIYQQHPPPHEYKQTQQQQQLQYGKQLEQQQAFELARKLQQLQEQEQVRIQQQKLQEQEQLRIQQQQQQQKQEELRNQQQQQKKQEQLRIQQQQQQKQEQLRIQQQQQQKQEQLRIQQQVQQQQQAQHEAQRQSIQQQQQQSTSYQWSATQTPSQQQQQQQYSSQPKASHPVSKLHTQISGDSLAAPASLDHQAYHYPLAAPQTHRAPATPTPHSVVFVVTNAPTLQSQLTKAQNAQTPQVSQLAYTQKSPHEYVSAAFSGAVTSQPTKPAPPTPAAIVRRPHGGYTFVEVQKSVNIHNKLITEKDGKLVEEHETIYPLPQYPAQQFQQQKQSVVAQPTPQPAAALPQTHQQTTQASKPAATEASANRAEVPHTHYPIQYAQQLSLIEEGVRPTDYYFVPKEYASLAANPINVQHIDEPEQQEQASSYAHLQQALTQPYHSPSHGHSNGGHEGGQHPQQYVQYVQQNYAQAPETQQTPHPSQQQTQHAPNEQHTQEVHQQAPPQPHVEVHQPVAEKEIVEQVVTQQVEKIVERPVHIPYPVHVQQYIDRPYPVQEIVETHIPVPYPVPEPVAVPVHVERYIDRPYPVEKIVEKRIPYPVEKVVEKIVEKEIPIEVEKVVEKFVDRPVPIPIRVPVAVPVPYAQQPLPEYDENAEIFGPAYHPHPNALGGWSDHTALSDFGGRGATNLQIPPKVLQNYYTRMLKKLLPQALGQRGTPSTASSTTNTVYTHTQARAKKPTTSAATTKQPKSVSPSSSSNKQHSFKIGDVRFDLKPPPPPPTGPEWSKGARYIYNTLPHDLPVADTADTEQLTDTYNGPFGAPNEPYDEFQRWRNGHTLKRSPQFGRNLQMEYGFKPPLVPSVEINDQGIPVNAEEKKTEQ